MSNASTDIDVLRRLRQALDTRYGDSLARVVLFGSRARDEARPDSDYDVAVFLSGMRGFGEEARTLAEIETDILTDTGAVVNAWPWPASAYDDLTGLMREVRLEGRDL